MCLKRSQMNRQAKGQIKVQAKSQARNQTRVQARNQTRVQAKSQARNQTKSYTSRHAIRLKDIALIGLMAATIEIAKMAFSFLPNVELTSFLLILYTLVFGSKTLLVVPVFILLEGAVYGMQLWWIMYLYAWPLLVLLSLLFRKQTSVFFWSIFSAIFGLSFGALCSLPYFFIGWAGGTLQSGLSMAFTWWVAGIPWDIVHCVGNFTLMLVLYYPVKTVLKRCSRYFYNEHETVSRSSFSKDS